MDFMQPPRGGRRPKDVLQNFQTIQALFSRAVKETGGKPVEDIFDRAYFMTAAECKARGLIDEIVPLVAAKRPAK
jgi:ATP-dependent protease ClpP protease subunit